MNGLFLSAQISDGIDATYSGMFNTAKQCLLKELANPQKVSEACYYLGEAYRLSGKSDSAMFYFDLGSKDPVNGGLCTVGKAGLLMATDPGQSENMIKKAKSEKKLKTNPAFYVAIAKAYAANNQTEKALEKLEEAKEADKTYVYIYLTEGDIALQNEMNNMGKAASKYETAIYYDPACKPAYMKLARLYYSANNYAPMMQNLSNIKQLDPSYPPCLKLEGDFCYEKGDYACAVNAYAGYLRSPEAVLKDHIRYSYALFFNKDYQKSLEEVNAIIQSDPGNLVFKRLISYNLFEIGDFQRGLAQMTEFFNSAKPSDLIYSDYKYYARLLAKNDQDSLSILIYRKAMEASDTPNEFYKEIALSYEKMKKYDEAASYFEKHIKTNSNLVPADLLFWGRDCYLAAGAIDSVIMLQNPAKADERIALYLKADSIFGDFAKRSPNHYMGYLWRARVNAILDPKTETGLAKPYYERVATILDNSGTDRKKELIEAFQYLGYFYYVKNDIQNSLVYWNKILVIDPNNTVALLAIAGIDK